MGLFKKYLEKELTWKEKRDLTEQNNKLSNESKENQKVQTRMNRNLTCSIYLKIFTKVRVQII